MAIRTGMVVGGVVLPGTEWVLRDDEGWWADDAHGVRKRAGTADILVGHWTAGGTRTGDATGRRVVTAMKARKNQQGKPLEVAIHFVIGWDGKVFQTADLSVATVHVGDREVIRRSIGVETAWPGTMKQAEKLNVHGTPIETRVAGTKVVAMAPSAELITSWVKLADTLATMQSAAVSIPRQVPADGAKLRRTRFSKQEQAAWKGAQEHFHIGSTTKVDAAGLLLEALVKAGWRL